MQQNAYSTRQEVSGTFGAAASSHWIVSQVGMSILEKGGNAFDAAVAAAFTMHVAEPHQNSLGGEVVILCHRGEAPAPVVICGQGVAPAKANIAHMTALGFKYMPPTGVVSAVVPGAFDAWMMMLRDYGTMPVGEVLAPAIYYAKNGVPLSRETSQHINHSADLFREHWPSSAEVYLPHNEVPQAGELFCNPDLAATYELIVKEAECGGTDRLRQIESARKAFYAGPLAERIAAFCATPTAVDSSGICHAGLLDFDDMGSWQATYEAPESIEFHGWRVFKPGIWTQGPAFLQLLALLNDGIIFDMDPFGAEYAHHVVESLKLAYADREAWYGDAETIRPDLSALLAEDYTAQRRKLISAQASLELRPGSIGNRQPHLPQFETKLSGGVYEERLTLATLMAREPGSGDTCHLDVMDRWGNSVAATPSGGGLSFSPTVPGLGFSLNTRAQMFWLQYGLSSSLVPRTRPRTTLSPTIASRGDGATLAFGTRGADYQDQWVAQFLFRHIGFAMDLQQAWDAPMFHSDHWPMSIFPRDASPGKLTLDERFEQGMLGELRERGHDVRVKKGGRWGRGCATKREGRTLRAAASSTVLQSVAAAR